MADYFVLLVTIAASLYGYSYARWLKQNGNIAGAISIFVLIAATLAIPVAMWYLGLY